MDFTIIKSNYDKGLWNKEMVRQAVIKGVITKVQYKKIVGTAY